MKVRFLLAIFCAVLSLAGVDAYAQNDGVSQLIAVEAQSVQQESFNVRVSDLTHLLSKNQEISLWGIDKIDINAPVFILKARVALEKKIGGQAVLCSVMEREFEGITAQCDNSTGEDLSLFLLNHGYASVDRQAVRDTLYEQAYLSAESLAQVNGKGFWADKDSPSSQMAAAQSKNFVMGAFFLMAVFVLAVAILSVYIMRGFGRVVDLQNQSLDLAAKERTLKEKEKFIIASLIHAEVRENKPKIDAYLMIYEEMLRDFADPSRAPKCMQTGEVMQKQPAMSREVFDGNTGRLDLFSEHLSSDIIHYYARIKTNPDYIEITTDMQVEEARRIITSCVDNAKKIDTISDHLLDKFAQNPSLNR